MTASHCYNTKAFVKALLTGSLITLSVKAGNAGSQTEGALLFFCVGLVCMEDFLHFFPPSFHCGKEEEHYSKLAMQRVLSFEPTRPLKAGGCFSKGDFPFSSFLTQLTLRAAHMPTALYPPLLFLTIPLLFNIFCFIKPLSTRMILAPLEGKLLDTLHSFFLEMCSS